MQRVGRRSKSFHVAPFKGKKYKGEKKKKRRRRKKIPRETSVYSKHQKSALQRSQNGTRHTSASETRQRDRTGGHRSSPCLPRSWPPAGWCCYGSNQATSSPLPSTRFALPRGCCTADQPRPMKRNLKSNFLCLGKKNPPNLQQRILPQPLKPLLGISSFGPVCSDSRAVIYRRHLFIIVISILPSSSPGAALTPSTLPLPGDLPTGKPLPPLRRQKPRTPTRPLFPRKERQLCSH